MNLLLIHSLVRDKQTVIDSLTTDIRYIIIDYVHDNLQTIKDKISALNLSFDRIGLFQENDNKPYYQITRRFQPSTLVGVEMEDAGLDTWTDFTDLLIFCKEKGMINFDMMDCNVASDKNWLYVISHLENNLSININASENETGNSAMQGDWILEKGNVNLIGTYFTENIKEYKYTLGGGTLGNYSLILGNDNNIYACGDSSYGKFGFNINTSILNKMQLPEKPTGIIPIKIAGGLYHTVVLFSDGTVYACGYNEYGQLGINSNETKYVFTQMINSSNQPITGAINIACGRNHTVVLFQNKTVYACGLNNFGQLGINSNTEKKVLTQMVNSSNAGITGATNIACGGYHTVVLFSDSTVYACGRNNYGQLGINSADTKKQVLTQMVNSSSAGITGATNIAGGFYHTVVLFENKTVYACGDNSYGQLGINSSGPGTEKKVLTQMVNSLGTEITGATNIACGYYHTIVLFENKTVYACGLNDDGQLGINSSGPGTDKQVLTQMVNSIGAAITGATNIACGAYHTVVLFSNNAVYACGRNDYGQLGINSNEIKYVLTQMVNNLNQLITGATNIACGAYHTVVLFENKTIYSCGDNTNGQLGFNINTSILNKMQLPEKSTGIIPIKIAGGENHTVVLFSDGTVYACGQNTYGQLGINSNVTKYVLTQMVNSSNQPITGATNIACGGYHTVVLFSNNTVYACGDNYYGQLGINSSGPGTDKQVLTQMVNSLGAINITCGYYYTVVLFEDKTVYACGWNYYGQLGINSSGPGTDKQVLTQMVNSLGAAITGATNIACGGFHTVVLFSNNAVYACGSNLYGQLGIDSNTNQKVLTQMVNSSNQPITGATNIACGGYHTVVLFENKTVYACGLNDDGQLGINLSGSGTEKKVLTQMVDSSDIAITGATNIACGSYHTIVFLNNIVYACGYNGYGELGINSYSEQQVLTQMKYNNNGTITNFNIGTVATFATIFFNINTKITKIYDGNINANLTLTPSMYRIYTYNPLQPTITINTYTAKFNNSNIGTNKPITIFVSQLKDNTNNINYLFVNPYVPIYGDIINGLLQYINKYTTLNMLSKLEVQKTNTAAYAVIGYKSKKIDPLFSVFLQNL